MTSFLPTFFPIILAAIVVLSVVDGYFRNKKREMIHRERMAALEKGLQPSAEPLPYFLSHPEPEPGPRGYLLRGLVWLFVGLGVLAALFVLLGQFPGYLGKGLPLLLFLGFVPAGVGVAYLTFFAIAGRKPRPPAS